MPDVAGGILRYERRAVADHLVPAKHGNARTAVSRGEGEEEGGSSFELVGGWRGTAQGGRVKGAGAGQLEVARDSRRTAGEPEEERGCGGAHIMLSTQM